MNGNEGDMCLTPRYPAWKPSIPLQPSSLASESDPKPLWKPLAQAQGHLHYQELYRGIYGYLKLPPNVARRGEALAYLEELKRCYHYHNVLQRDRIQWTEAWLLAIKPSSYSSQ